MLKENTKARPILYVLMFLMLLLFSVGLINYYYVKKIDDSYTELINSMMKGDNTIHEITNNSTRTILAISRILSAKKEDEKEKRIAELNKYIEKNNINFQILDSLCNDDFKRKNLEELVLLRKEFLHSKDSLMLLIKKNGIVESTKEFYRQVLKSKLENYQDEQMLFAHNAKFVLSENSNALTILTERIRNITFGLMFAPFVIIILGLMYIIIILYRNNNYEEEDV